MLYIINDENICDTKTNFSHQKTFMAISSQFFLYNFHCWKKLSFFDLCYLVVFAHKFHTEQLQNPQKYIVWDEEKWKYDFSMFEFLCFAIFMCTISSFTHCSAHLQTHSLAVVVEKQTNRGMNWDRSEVGGEERDMKTTRRTTRYADIQQNNISESSNLLIMHSCTCYSFPFLNIIVFPPRNCCCFYLPQNLTVFQCFLLKFTKSQFPLSFRILCNNNSTIRITKVSRVKIFHLNISLILN